MSTIFSKIIDREIPAHIVYEDDDVLAFLDNTPINQGHALVVPKIACANIFDATPETMCALMKAAQQVGQAVKTAVNADGVNLIMNNGEAAGQEVFHAHIHVVPRFDGDGVFQKPTHTDYADNEAETVATQIIAALSE